MRIVCCTLLKLEMIVAILAIYPRSRGEWW